MWRIATNRKAAADELRIVFSTLFSLEGLDLSQVRASAVASVVPQLTKAWMQAIKDATGALSLVCNAETAAGLVDAGNGSDLANRFRFGRLGNFNVGQHVGPFFLMSRRAGVPGSLIDRWRSAGGRNRPADQTLTLPF